MNAGTVKEKDEQEKSQKKVEKKRQDGEANLQSAPAVRTKPSCQNVPDKDFMFWALV